MFVMAYLVGKFAVNLVIPNGANDTDPVIKDGLPEKIGASSTKGIQRVSP